MMGTNAAPTSDKARTLRIDLHQDQVNNQPQLLATLYVINKGRQKKPTPNNITAAEKYYC
jgi:hypothetical protein